MKLLTDIYEDFIANSKDLIEDADIILADSTFKNFITGKAYKSKSIKKLRKVEIKNNSQSVYGIETDYIQADNSHITLVITASGIEGIFEKRYDIYLEKGKIRFKLIEDIEIIQ